MENQIKEWLAFNDNEIGTLQNFVFGYVQEHDLTKEKAYILGVLSSQFQYHMRCVKELIVSNETKHLTDVVTFIKSINLFDNLCEFTKNKLVESYKTMGFEYQYQYLNEDSFKTSFFNRTEIENTNIQEKDWEKISKKIKKYSKS